MARQVIILETRRAGDGVTQVNGVQWFPIAAPAARVPKPGVVSGGTNVTAAEQASLEDGSVREEGFAIPFAASSTTAQIKAELVRRYADRSAAIAAEPPTRQFYGVFFDGTAWSA